MILDTENHIWLQGRCALNTQRGGGAHGGVCMKETVETGGKNSSEASDNDPAEAQLNVAIHF